MARLVLVGLPGTGKSSLAKLLSREWSCDYVDTDEFFEAENNLKPSDFIRQYGEEEFRSRELAALRTALGTAGVVATGGGIVTTPAARALLKSSPTYWLDADDHVLVQRTARGDRPLLGDDRAASIRTLRAARETLYEEVSQERIDTSGKLKDVAIQLIELSQKANS